MTMHKSMMMFLCAFLAMPAMAAPKAKPSPGDSSELDAMRAEIDALWEAQAATVPGATFIRWGSTDVPTGMTALDTGWGYMSDSGSEGGITGPLLLPGPHPMDFVPGEIGSVQKLTPVALVAPQEYFERHMDTGEYNHPLLNGVRLYSSTPIATMWGDSAVPAGWELVYTGYIYGTSENASHQTDAICVDKTHPPAHRTGYFPDTVPAYEMLSPVYGPEQVTYYAELICKIIRKI
ncbi:MAG: hypothetical protein KC912_26270 [Proteobacteria bacterium]|nr:hypothetical protein [Pseudomonadota bacterium]